MTNEELIVLARSGDIQAEEQFFKQNEKFPRYMSDKFRNTKIEREERVSLCTFGMLKAYKTFDPDKDIKFATYAARCMSNEVLMFLRKQRFNTISLSDVAFHEHKDNSELTFEEMVGFDDLGFEKFETSESLRVVLQEFNKTASERQKQVLSLRVENEISQNEVAEMLGISQSYISRLEKRALTRLRKIARKHGLEGSYIKGEVNKMAFERKMNVESFVYLVKNYPELKNNDLAKLLGVSYPSIIQYNKKYQAGKYDDILPEPGDLDERVEEYKREHYPETLASAVTITQLPKLEEDVEVKLKPVKKHQEWDSIKEHYEAQQESSLKIPEETLQGTRKIVDEALKRQHPILKPRPKISQMVIDLVTKLVDNQDEKGMKKYGVSIDSASDSDYDWKLMALEEMADGMKYLIKENQRLEQKIQTIKEALREVI